MNKNERAVWGPQIQAARIAAGLGREELAAMANTSRRTLSDYERGIRVAHEPIVRRLIQVLSIDDEPSWDEDVAILAPALMTLIQHVPPERRIEAVRTGVEVLSSFVGDPDESDGVLNADPAIDIDDSDDDQTSA